MSSFSVPDDEICFAEETEQVPTETSWKILIVDDEVEVHNVTRLALRDFTFAGKSLQFISAYSAQEATQLIQVHPDIAIVFLDVVMENESAGLYLVKFIREDLNNHLVRIILRTGQPGQAPENMVAVNYGIDDYKTKTELTAQKLFITVVTALRAFSTLLTLLEGSRELEAQIIQHKQAEIALRVSEMSAIAKANQLEQSLQALRQSQLQFGQPAEFLNQRVTEATQSVLNWPESTDGFQTMSVMTRIARMLLRITDEYSAKLGISQTKLAVLLYLNSEPALFASPSALALHCGVSRAAMTGLLDALEQKGYVERDNHPSDRRALMIKLTPKGQQFLSLIAPQDHYPLSELIGSLSDLEQQKLNQMLTKLFKLFEKKKAED
jgi:DNA-binding MarR family transcriptional regulator/DNA-binding response OmpR family regulator